MLYAKIVSGITNFNINNTIINQQRHKTWVPSERMQIPRKLGHLKMLAQITNSLV